MALPKDYAGDGCSLARALEVVGERWTLAIPRAVLTHRLTTLVEADVLTIVPGAHGHDEYVLTGKGLDLWPVVRALLTWGDDYYSAKGPLRLFRHAFDHGDGGRAGPAAPWGGLPPVADLVVAPGPGWSPRPGKTDLVSAALWVAHRLLTSVSGRRPASRARER